MKLFDEICKPYSLQMDIEKHPFEEFLPENAGLLFLGTFPAKPHKWSMNFYYPNFMNDFWRIMGLIFYSDKEHFQILKPKKAWNEAAIREFCSSEGLAFSDTAEEIRRLKGTASDADLEIVKARDIAALLKRLPVCKAVVATGGLASEVVSRQFGCEIPPVGGSCTINLPQTERTLSFFRLPSTSRAYPLALEKKAEAYRKMFEESGLIPKRG